MADCRRRSNLAEAVAPAIARDCRACRTGNFTRLTLRNCLFEITSVYHFLALRYSDYQSDVYRKQTQIYYPSRGLAVLGEGCRGVLD